MCEDGQHEYVKFADSKDWLCKECYVQRSATYMAGYNYAGPGPGVNVGNYLAQVYAAPNMATYMNTQTAFIRNLVDDGTITTTTINTRYPRYNTIITNLQDAQLIDT